MPEPKTLPYGYTPADHVEPSAEHHAWLDQAERLVAAFERSSPAPTAGEVAPSLGFILMAADYLWDHQSEAAHFGKLDVQGLALHCRTLLCRDEVARTFIQTLSAFYAFLRETHEVEPGEAQAITAQLLALRD